MNSRVIGFRLAAGAVFAVALAACGGGGGSSPGPAAPPPIVVTHTFPANVASPSGGGAAWDITQVTTTLTSVNPGAAGDLYDTLRIDLTFQQDISGALPAVGTFLNQGTQLGVATGFDPAGDGNGTMPGCASGATPFTYATDSGGGLGRLLDGNYALYKNNALAYPTYPTKNAGGVPGLEAVTTVAGHVLTQVYKLSAIGVVGPQVPKLKVQFLVFNGTITSPPTPVTECIPLDGSEISVAGP